MARQVCDVAVVGGGLVGTALAFELVAGGAEVVLVDRGDPGRATDTGAGILSPDTAAHPEPRWTAMAQAAGRHHEALVPRLAAAGAGDTGYARCGLVSVGLDEREHDWFAAASAAAERRARGRCGPSPPTRRAALPGPRPGPRGRLVPGGGPRRRAVPGGGTASGGRGGRPALPPGPAVGSTWMRMLANVGVEVFGGSIPIVGDLFDMALKANLRNLRIIEDHLWGKR